MLTHVQRFFAEPETPSQRQYEALRSFFIEGRKSADVARAFGYSSGSFRVLCSAFRKSPTMEFFGGDLKKTPVRRQKTKTERLRHEVVRLRKQNLSVYDIADALRTEGHSISASMVSHILREEGFSRLPRRMDERRALAIRPELAKPANAEALDLSPRRFRTQFGGLFLFVPDLVRLALPRLLTKADFPGTKMVPAEHAVRSLLALKLFGNRRHHHVMSHTFDEGLALFAGLNSITKRAFMTEYSSRIRPGSYQVFMDAWFDKMNTFGLVHGDSFDLDFHSIPFHGEDALVEKHYVSKRSRRQKGVLAFLAQDDDERFFCYANSLIRKENQHDEVLRFVDYWKRHTGRIPGELVFDSKLTTYPNLNRLNQMGIRFITLRRRSEKLLEEAWGRPSSAWRRIQLENIARAYRTPRILDQQIQLRGYEGWLRQIMIDELGHEDPTLLITNQLKRSPVSLIGRYASRMIIENGIADAIDFFHMDALSSSVPMKTDCDLQLTLLASSLYRCFAKRIGNGYRKVHARRIFRDFINATASVTIDERAITVCFQKRAHNPLLMSAGFAETNVRVPWLGGKRLNFVFG